MPNCEIVTIGSELLNGSVLNTNAQFLAKRASELDFEVTRQMSCRDREEEILEALSAASRRSDLIFVTGGLGPTPDDITRESVARFFRCGLKFDPVQYRLIVRHFRKLNRMTPLITRREAYLPEIAKPLLNRFGIALGFYVFQDGKLLVVLPGVPMELTRMYDTSVRSLVERTFKKRPKFHQLVIRVAGLYETQVMRKLGRHFFKGRDFEFGIYPEIGEVTLRIKTKRKGLISVLGREAKKKIGCSIYGFDEKSLPTVIGERLTERGVTVAVAESCTGGLLSARLTEVPGASRYFKGGFVAYANEVKCSELRIPPVLIRTKGAVSREAASRLAKGVRLREDSDIGVGITGIAGPGGGSKSKPVGLVYIAVSDQKRTRAFQFRFLGDREKVRLQATQKALFCLWQWLNR